MPAVSFVPAQPTTARDLDIDREVARHATEEELEEAAEFFREHEHEQIPRADSGPIVYPDGVGIKIKRALERVTEIKRRTGVVPDELTATDSVNRAASLLSGRPSRRDRSEDRFMSWVDEFLEPYQAIQNGMSLGQAAKKYDIADIQGYVRCVEDWFKQLGTWFQIRLERAIEKRQRDATQRAKPDPPRVIEVDVSDQDWKGINIASQTTRKASRPKRDPAWAGVRAPLVRHDRGPWWGSASVEAEATQNRELVEEWHRNQPEASESSAEPIRDSREGNANLDRGLNALLETNLSSEARRDLSSIVEWSKQGVSRAEIAKRLKISLSTVKRRLEQIRRAGTLSAVRT